MDQGEALKRAKTQLAQARDENGRLKREYEYSCNEMKSEFEEIKAEMEQTWNEQQSLHDDQMERLKHNYEKRLEFEACKNDDLTKENELLRQKITRIKDVFVDTSEQRGRPQNHNQMHQDVHPGQQMSFSPVNINVPSTT